MLKNYLTVALRTLWKQRGFSFINVVGLAVGLAFCALIALYVQDEWTFDRFHENGDRIVRFHRATYTPEGAVEDTDVSLPMPLGPALEADFPEVEATVRFLDSEFLVRPVDATGAMAEAREMEVLFADPALFEVFSFPLRYGTPDAALADLHGAVVTPATARALFGDAEPLGRQIEVRIDGTFVTFTVAAVAEPPPSNSTVQFGLVLPFEAWATYDEWARGSVDSWQSAAYPTYALLRKGAPVPSAERLLDFRRRYYPDELDDWREDRNWTSTTPPVRYRVQRLHDIHLDPSVSGGLTPPSDPLYAWVLSAIALSVLVLACINFMTLAVARSAGRAREVGVRKAIGAQRGQLAMQFWSEALLMAGAAFAFSLAVAHTFLPTFNRLTEKALSFEAAGATLWLVLGGTALAAGIVAGSYPALLLSGFQPVESLRGRVGFGRSGSFTRALVAVQFAVSVFLMGGTFVMLAQLDYVRSAALGYDEEHVVVIPTQGADGDAVLGRFRQALSGRPDIEGVTGASLSFGRGLARRGFTHERQVYQLGYYAVAADYLDVLGLRLLEGRPFDPARPADSTMAVIINEAAVRAIPWEGSPVGQRLAGFTDDPATDPFVVGIVEDYHDQSLESEIEPAVLRLATGDRWSHRINHLLIRIAPTDVPATLTHLEATWIEAAGDLPFAYSFLDDDLGAMYAEHERWSAIVRYAALFAVLIACLGLFGLAAQAATRRTKEIGVRKVLGATATSIVALLSKDFAVLVLVGFAVATPVAWLALSRWLDGFAYRIDLGPGVFLLAGLVALVVALLTVGLHAVRAATADPVKALRYE